MTLLNLTWSNHSAGAGPLKFGDLLEHFVNTGLPSLAGGWQVDPINVKFGSASPGKQGCVIERISDNVQFALFATCGDEDETVPGGPSSNNSSVGYGFSSWLATSGIMVAMNKRLSNLWTAKSDIIGTNGSNALKALAYELGSNTGYFRRGETLQVAGTYEATIREVIPDLGLILIENWSSGNPTYNQIDNGASLSGLTSGATATVHNRGPNPMTHLSAEPVGVYYLKNLSGAAPSGTITGGTTGYTATYSAYAANEGGKLTVTAGQGRWLLDETITWSGGSAEIAFWDWGFDQIASIAFDGVANMNSTTTLKDADSADWSSSDYLIGYDTDRLVVLFPRGNSATDGYVVILLGKWAESLYGLGEIDLCGAWNGSERANMFEPDVNHGGELILPNGRIMHFSTSLAVAEADKWNVPPMIDEYGSHTADESFAYNNNFIAPLLSSAGFSAIHRIVMGTWQSNSRGPLFKMLGFFIINDSSPAFKDLLTHPGGDRVGLKVGRQGTSKTYIEFTDGSIVP